MARPLTPTQLRSLIRQEEARQRQAVNRYNADVKRHNQEVERAAKEEERRAVDRYNREVKKRNQEIDRALRQDEQRARNEINRYNREVKAHERRLKAEMQRLARQSAPAPLVVVQQSTSTLGSAFHDVETAYAAEDWGQGGAAVVELAEAETANSASVANVLLGGNSELDQPIEETILTDELRRISEDLDNRWQGARYAINPRNPDAARHFCTSSREIIAQILEIKAPDDAVLDAIPDCPMLDSGKPVRRAKIDYLLASSNLSNEQLSKFVETDVVDVSGLFRVFNDGTHGSAGTLDVDALRALKDRVEGTIQFLATISG
jgi:Predicted pPIWI-associating nuclease